MSEKRTNRLIIGAIFVIIAAYGITRTISGCSGPSIQIAGGINPFSTEDIHLEAELPGDSLQELSVSSVSADIEVSFHSDSAVRAVLTGSAGVQPDLSAVVRGNRGTMEVTWPRSVNVNSRNMKLELLLPSGYNGNLKLHTVSGTVLLPEESRFSAVSLETVSGNVSFRGLECSSLEFSSVSGDMTGDGLSGTPTVTIETTSGELNLSGDAARVSVSSISGDSQLSLSDLNGEMAFSTTSGNVELTLPESISAAVSYSSVSGNFESDIPIMTTSSKGNALEGTIGGGRHRLEFSTVSGNVRIRER